MTTATSISGSISTSIVPSIGTRRRPDSRRSERPTAVVAGSVVAVVVAVAVVMGAGAAVDPPTAAVAVVAERPAASSVHEAAAPSQATSTTVRHPGVISARCHSRDPVPTIPVPSPDPGTTGTRLDPASSCARRHSEG